MKNIRTAHPQSPASNFHALKDLFVTDACKQSAYVDNLVTKAAARCPLIFEMTNPQLEWSHFTSYLGCLALRTYDKPAVQDLYYIHELIHIATLPYTPDLDFYNWRTNCFRNELTASMNSEVYVYFEIPQLREQAFPHEIWADRFLTDKWKAFYAKTPLQAQERLRRERKLVSKNPNPHDYAEQQIAGYFHQNMQWALTWKPIYKEIDAHMSAYVTGQITAQEHREWIESQMQPPGGHKDIPFCEQAVTFSEETARNKKLFGNQNWAKK